MIWSCYILIPIRLLKHASPLLLLTPSSVTVSMVPGMILHGHIGFQLETCAHQRPCSQENLIVPAMWGRRHPGSALRMERGQIAWSTCTTLQVLIAQFHFSCTWILLMTIWTFAADDPDNANCLNSILNDNQKSETWLVFLVHGFTGSLDDSQGSLIDVARESIFARCNWNWVSVVRLFCKK